MHFIDRNYLNTTLRKLLHLSLVLIILFSSQQVIEHDLAVDSQSHQHHECSAFVACAVSILPDALDIASLTMRFVHTIVVAPVFYIIHSPTIRVRGPPA